MNDRSKFDSDTLFEEPQASGASALAELKAYVAGMEFEASQWAAVGTAFRALVDAGFDQLPLPGSGATAQRWNALAAVAARDLSLVKFFEGHTDALAILAEVQPNYPLPEGYWGVWASESPNARITASPQSGATDPVDAATVELNGVKQWCSGAAAVTHALVTGWERDGAAGLYAVDLNQAGVMVASGGWHAVGMQATASVEVHFEHVSAQRIGNAGTYISRPGFWQGGAGIAACWYGAIAELARSVVQATAQRPNPHRNAHLGSILVAVGNAASTLREAAGAIDEMPYADARWLALRTRLSVEDAASAVLEHAARALGAGPVCLDAHIARLMADLPVFMRQSHAEHDLAALGEHHAQAGEKLPLNALDARHIWQI
jgi:hypothetical protein